MAQKSLSAVPGVPTHTKEQMADVSHKLAGTLGPATALEAHEDWAEQRLILSGNCKKVSEAG